MSGDMTWFKGTLPEEYDSPLDLRETERAIKFVKDRFQSLLAEALNLSRVSAPIAVLSRTGINDHLDGTQKPVCLTVKELGETAEIVQSLAKWKRAALGDYGFGHGEGLYTDMNAIRPDEAVGNFHSIYVDQWDWEVVISEEERTVDCLQTVVRKIYGAIRALEAQVCAGWEMLGGPFLPEDITFIHSQDLEDKYPDLHPRERENRICEEAGAVFVIGIGAELASGQPHDARAADYDDWATVSETGKPGLNGDILVWYPVLNRALELSSMGIRVDATSLRKQLELHDELRRLEQPFHKGIINGELPLTVGGGIGQSRLCMLMLRKVHVGEVQAGVWSDEMRAECAARGIRLL